MRLNCCYYVTLHTFGSQSVFEESLQNGETITCTPFTEPRFLVGCWFVTDIKNQLIITVWKKVKSYTYDRATHWIGFISNFLKQYLRTFTDAIVYKDDSDRDLF